MTPRSTELGRGPTGKVAALEAVSETAESSEVNPNLRRSSEINPNLIIDRASELEPSE